MDVERLLRSRQFANAKKQGAKAVLELLDQYYEQAVAEGDEGAQYRLAYEKLDWLFGTSQHAAAKVLARDLAGRKPVDPNIGLFFSQHLLIIDEPSLAARVIRQVLPLLPDPLAAILDFGRVLRARRVEVRSGLLRAKDVRRPCLELALLANSPRFYEEEFALALLPLDGDLPLLEAKRDILERMWSELMRMDRFHGGRHAELIRQIEQEIDTLARRVAEADQPA